MFPVRVFTDCFNRETVCRIISFLREMTNFVGSIALLVFLVSNISSLPEDPTWTESTDPSGAHRQKSPTNELRLVLMNKEVSVRHFEPCEKNHRWQLLRIASCGMRTVTSLLQWCVILDVSYHS